MDVGTSRALKLLVLYAEPPGARTLSYYTGWPRAFERHPRVEVEPVNLHERRWRLPRGRVDAVVLLHSVYSNEPYLRGRLLRAVARRPEPKAWFLANEYKDMPARMRFAEDAGVRLLVTQSTLPEVKALYEERLPGVTTVGIVNAGLDTELFVPRTPPAERPIDIGYRSFAAPLYLGHEERTAIADRVASAATGLRLDLSVDPADRMEPPAWAAFLDRCRAQLGCEAGTDFLELDDRSRDAVNAYLAERPDATFAEVYARFFRDYADAVSGRVLSGRIAEAAGTRTTQLLVEGEYGGYFRPGEHYIAVRKDFSNLADALEQLADRAHADEVAGRALEVAREELRFERLVDRFLDALAPLVD